MKQNNKNMSTSTVLRMGNVGYASVAPPKPPLKSIKPIPTRPLEPFKEPPVDIILPRVPTIRTDSQSSQPASEPGVSEANSSSTVLLYPPLTFHSTSSKIDSKGAAYRLTTHLFPSAYPRSPFLSGSTPIDTAEYERIGKVEEKEVRERMLAEYKAVLQRWADEINNAVEDGSKGKKGQHDAQSYDSICAAQKRVMWNSVNRIVREDSDGGSSYPSGPRLTLFFAHANGFPKETWEPTIKALLSQFEESHSRLSRDSSTLLPVVEEIWVFEAVQHGDTGLINTGLLPRAYDWSDNARDVLHFLLYYMPEEIERAPSGEATVLPTHLSRLRDTVASRRRENGYSSRTLAAIGHSFGGCSVARAAIETPSLFSSLMLVDPVIQAPSNLGLNSGLAESALRRRNSWKSREECNASFLKSPFFTAWHPDVLNAYLQYAITEEDGAAKLKMSGLHETILFRHLRTAFETWQLLPQLDTRIPLFWLVSVLDGTALGGRDAMRETVWRRPVNTQGAMLPLGHLIPHEAPVESAAFIREYLIKIHSTRAIGGVGNAVSSLESNHGYPETKVKSHL